ncbi:hypothetical protein ACFV2U_46505 [Streptomyces sp. NPDC059697]|uniref:hypothetical protein n=1 Tax=Streptomyces sp. NPDC059697 TaxID=3346912 RepID=UPI0036C5F20A
MAELAEAAADHLNYSKHPVPVLFREVRAARALLARLLTPTADGTELHRQVGRLSGLLGNLAFHLDDAAGARTPWSPPCRTRTSAVMRRWQRGRTGHRAWWPAAPAT